MDGNEEIEDGASVIQSDRTKTLDPIKRTLNENELLNIGCLRLLVDDNERLKIEKAQFRTDLRSVSKKHEDLTDMYNVIDKECAVQKEKLKNNTANEIMHSILVSVGMLFIGLSKSAWDLWHFGEILLIAGATMWVSGTLSKVFKLGAK